MDPLKYLGIQAHTHWNYKPLQEIPYLIHHLLAEMPKTIYGHVPYSAISISLPKHRIGGYHTLVST